MNEHGMSRAVRLLVVGALAGLLGGNIYRRRRRRALVERAKSPFTRPESEWTQRDLRDYRWHERRAEWALRAERAGNRLLTWLTFGLYQPETLWCCDTAPWEDERRLWHEKEGVRPDGMG